MIWIFEKDLKYKILINVMSNIFIPIELYNKIMTYNIHPVAELIRKNHPIMRIIKPMIRKHRILNEQFANDFPEDEQELCSFSAYYMYFTNENPFSLRNHESERIFELGFTY